MATSFQFCKSNNSDRFTHNFIARHPYPLTVGRVIGFLDEFLKRASIKAKVCSATVVVDSRAKSEGDFLLSNIIGIGLSRPIPYSVLLIFFEIYR